MSGPWFLGPLRPVDRPPPPFCFFSLPPSCFFFPPAFPLFLGLLFFLCRLCGAGPVCVSWAVGCAAVCFGGAAPVVALCAVLSRPSGAGWCSVVLPVVFGCLLLGLASLCCLLVGLGVVFRWCCPCLAAWLAALWFGVVCLGVLLPCVLFCGAVLSCGGVLSCSAVCLRRCLCRLFVSCRCASAVCVLGCAFPVLSTLCGAVQRCAGALALCCPRRLCCFLCLVLLVPGVAACCWGSAGCSGCLALSFGVACRLWCPCLVWPSLGVFPVVSCSPVLCPVALCCHVVLCRGALMSFSFFAFFFPCWWCWFSVSPVKFPAKLLKMVFRFRK